MKQQWSGRSMTVWAGALILQAVGTFHSGMLLEEVKNLLKEQKKRGGKENPIMDKHDVEAKKLLLDRKFTHEEIEMLREVAPSLTRRWVILLSFISTNGWNWISTFSLISGLSKLNKELPFPSENVSLLEIASAIPYLIILIVKLRLFSRNSKSKRREIAKLVSIFSFTGVWYMLSLFNAQFQWTRNTTSSVAYYWIFLALLAVADLVSVYFLFLELLIATRMRKKLDLGHSAAHDGGDVMDRQNLLSSKLSRVNTCFGLLATILNPILAIFYFIGSAVHVNEDVAAFDITATAAFFILNYGHPEFVKFAYDEVLTRIKSSGSRNDVSV